MIFKMIISFRIEITHKTWRCFPLWWVLQWRAWNWLWRHSRVWEVSKEGYWWLWWWWCSYLLDELPHEELEDDLVFGTSGDLEGVPINHKFEEAIGGDEEEIILSINESFLTHWEDSGQVLEASRRMEESYDFEIADCSPHLSSKLSMAQRMQDVQVHVVLVSKKKCQSYTFPWRYQKKARTILES